MSRTKYRISRVDATFSAYTTEWTIKVSTDGGPFDVDGDAVEQAIPADVRAALRTWLDRMAP